MSTYLALNLTFIIVVALLLGKHAAAINKPWVLTLASLLALTLVFDNLMIILDFFWYSTDKLLGVYLYKAPIEDFFYAILAAFVVPALWNRFGKITRKERTGEHTT